MAAYPRLFCLIYSFELCSIRSFIIRTVCGGNGAASAALDGLAFRVSSSRRAYALAAVGIGLRKLRMVAVT